MQHIQIALQEATQQPGLLLGEHAASSSAAIATEEFWASLPSWHADPKHIAKHRLVAVNQSDPACAAFDILRTRVLQNLRQNKWTSVAITSPTPGCGKTVVALNLAFSLGRQKDCRCLLVDLDLRRPQIGKALGLKNPPSMESFLRGQIEAEKVLLRYGENVAIAANSQPVKLAAELLQSPDTAKVLKNLKRQLNPNVVLFDLPPMLSNDDVMAFLPSVDCAILVVAAEASTLREADVCERDLSQKSKVLGVVLNKCRYPPEKYGY